MPVRMSAARRIATIMALGSLAAGLPAAAHALDDTAGEGVDPVATQPASTELPGFRLVGTAPAAAAQPTETGRRLNTLHYHWGRVYYGHGDYAANTGSMTGLGTDVAYYSVLGGFGTALRDVPTEEISTFRTIGTSVVAPLIDPSAQAGERNSFAHGRLGWRVASGGVPSVHLYDVATNGDDLFLATGDTDGGGVWRSTDGGSSWARSLHGTDEVNDGFERYYWLGRIGDDVYTRLHHGWDHGMATSALMRFDGKAWTPVKNETGFGMWTMRGSDVQSFDDRLWTFHYEELSWFDGKRTRTLDAGVGEIVAITEAENGLYVLGSNGVSRIDARTKVTPLVKAAPGQLAGATSIAVGGGRVWVGTADSRLWSRWL